MENNKIPTHDPHTGELNPFYESLTGYKNPLIEDKSDDDLRKEYLFLIDYIGQLENKRKELYFKLYGMNNL